jgi:hypothetical protein
LTGNSILLLISENIILLAHQTNMSFSRACVGLGMHYVFGVPLSREMPSVTDLITDTRQARRYGYDAPLIVSKDPGTKFSYSGGGFLLLQHIVELVGGGKSVAELTRPFLLAGNELWRHDMCVCIV